MSHPSADTDGDFDLEADLDADVKLVGADVSCENCRHKDVCGVYWGIAPMFQQWAERTDGTPPFDLDDMAVICNYYDGVVE